MAQSSFKLGVDIKKVSAEVTVQSNGAILLGPITGNDWIPIFVTGSTGYIANGTGGYVYSPAVFGDNNPGTKKTIDVYMIRRGGVIAKYYLALKRRWRHDFSDESTDYISNGIRNNRNRALWRLVLWGCTNTTKQWKNDRILYFKSERKCSCDSNTIRFYKGSNKYDYEPKISGGNFCVPVELLTAIPERGCA